jgi:hypothetical protein
LGRAPQYGTKYVRMYLVTHHTFVDNEPCQESIGMMCYSRIFRAPGSENECRLRSYNDIVTLSITRTWLHALNCSVALHASMRAMDLERDSYREASSCGLDTQGCRSLSSRERERERGPQFRDGLSGRETKKRLPLIRETVVHISKQYR